MKRGQPIVKIDMITLYHWYCLGVDVPIGESVADDRILRMMLDPETNKGVHWTHKEGAA